MTYSSIFLIISRKQDLKFHSNLHEISNPVFWEKLENIISLSSADLAKRVVKVKRKGYTLGEVCLS